MACRYLWSFQGCRENHDPFVPNPRDWSAFRSTDYGYTRMQVHNTTHLYLEQVSDDQVSREGSPQFYNYEVNDLLQSLTDM